MIRLICCVCGLLALGCGTSPAPEGRAPGGEPARRGLPRGGTPAHQAAGPSGEVEKLAPQPAARPEPPPDLRTRKTGSDWPAFLGPNGDSVSTEKGIIAPWPKEGLHVVWHKRLGAGYATPAISRGRLFLFERHGDQARLSCLKSETGE